MNNQPKFQKCDKLVYLHDKNWTAEILDVSLISNGYSILEKYITGYELKSYSPFPDIEEIYKLQPQTKPFPRYFTHIDKFYDDTLYVSNHLDYSYIYSENSPKRKNNINLEFCLQSVKNGVWKELTKQEVQRKFGKLEYRPKKDFQPSGKKYNSIKELMWGENVPIEIQNQVEKLINKNQKTMEDTQKQSKFILFCKPNRFRLKYKNSRGEIKDYNGTVIDSFPDAFTAYINGRGIRRFRLDRVENLELE
jgi:hypothetical protein